MDSKKCIQSYVYVGDKRYFVSTIERDSSAELGPADRYNETLVFDCPERGEEAKLLSQHEDVSGYIDTHFDVCQRLFDGDLDTTQGVDRWI